MHINGRCLLSRSAGIAHLLCCCVARKKGGGKAETTADDKRVGPFLAAGIATPPINHVTSIDQLKTPCNPGALSGSR